ncbi:MAG: heterocyst development glycosyltransferase HepC [Leptolyngbyaceae bacterium]|nr:heterocyst development glycosyltransferase HepC [Leptolyngbyaceae bacterium]
MTNPTSSLNEYSGLPPEPPEEQLPSYQLNWRQGTLVGQSSEPIAADYLPPLDNKPWLIACLRSSPVRLVRLDLNMGAEKLKFWAEAAQEADKVVFLRIRSTYYLPHKQSPRQWRLKRLMDVVVAILLLPILLPVGLGIGLLLRLEAATPVLSQEWRVGQRGKLFPLFKFRTRVEPTDSSSVQFSPSSGAHLSHSPPPLGQWLHQSGWDNLPQLLNVLRGEISFVGAYPWRLEEAVQMSVEQQRSLNALPGITGTWCISPSSPLTLEVLYKNNLEYLHHWSLIKDLKLLLSGLW